MYSLKDVQTRYFTKWIQNFSIDINTLEHRLSPEWLRAVTAAEVTPRFLVICMKQIIVAPVDTLTRLYFNHVRGPFGLVSCITSQCSKLDVSRLLCG